MGHVVTLMRYGVKATAPMFIPGLERSSVCSNRWATRDKSPLRPGGATLGLGAPRWDLTAESCDRPADLPGDRPIGAFINLFNLLPFATLDGGRAFRSMNKNQRWLAVLGIGAIMSFCESNESRACSPCC